MIGDGEDQIKKLESIIVELLRIVRDDNLGNPKATNNIFLDKILGILSDFGKRFSLYPLRVIVYGNHKKLPL